MGTVAFQQFLYCILWYFKTKIGYYAGVASFTTNLLNVKFKLNLLISVRKRKCFEQVLSCNKIGMFRSKARILHGNGDAVSGQNNFNVFA